MAGDWIPMRTGLQDDPTVIFIARMIRIPADHVVGKLHRFWSWADAHTEDGVLLGVDMDWIDAYVKKRGFAHAMATAPHPWLEVTNEGVTVLNFTRWFGKCAKARLTNTKRQSVSRSQRDECHGDSATKARPQNRTGQDRVIAPALGGADFQKAVEKARTITAKLGECRTEKNKRLVIGACIIAEELGQEWLNCAVRETCEAHAIKPYAYLSTILTRTAEADGVDFLTSIARLDFPVAKRPDMVSEVPSC